MGRGPSAFRQADYVRAVKASRAAGLEVYRSEIHPDGRIIIHHRPEGIPPIHEETFDEWWAKNRPGD